MQGLFTITGGFNWLLLFSAALIWFGIYITLTSWMSRQISKVFFFFFFLYNHSFIFQERQCDDFSFLNIYTKHHFFGILYISRNFCIHLTFQCTIYLVGFFIPDSILWSFLQWETRASSTSLVGWFCPGCSILTTGLIIWPWPGLL